MLGSAPIHGWILDQTWNAGICAASPNCGGSQEIYLCQKPQRIQYFVYVGTDFCREFLQYSDDFPLFGSFQFAYLIVCFHNGRRLDKYSLARGGFIVYDTFDLPFQCRSYGDDQSAVAQSWADVPIYVAFTLGFCNYAAQTMGNTSHGYFQRMADGKQFAGSSVLHSPIFIQRIVYSLDDFGESMHVLAKAIQCRIRHFLFRLIGLLLGLRLLLSGICTVAEVIHQVEYRLERALQVKQVQFLHVGTFGPGFQQSLASVMELLLIGILGFLHETCKFHDTVQSFTDFFIRGRKLQLPVHPLGAQHRYAAPLQLCADIIKADFTVKILRIYHWKFFQFYQVVVASRQLAESMSAICSRHTNGLFSIALR